MTLTATRVQCAYEACPYPGAEAKPIWFYPPMEWILEQWRAATDISGPNRILIAGCGTGAEAFAVRRRFPEADIVAVDFSPKSIASANEQQRRRRHRRPIRFLVADFAESGFDKNTGQDFDFVACHGVLTYVPAAGKALGNLARCLTPDGALYLGVNGIRHPSNGLRAVLPTFGFDMGRWADTPALREVLQLCDAIVPERSPIAVETAPYLASDVFGSFFQNLPLSDWIAMGRAAGFSFQASYSSHRDLRRAVAKGLCRLLIPRSRAEVCQLLDTLQPNSFHRLLFTRRPSVSPPWNRPSQLTSWRPTVTPLFRCWLPRPSLSDRTVTFASHAMNTHLSWHMPGWLIELLRGSDGHRSIGQILSTLEGEVPSEDLVHHLYVLHQMLVINLRH